MGPMKFFGHVNSLEQFFSHDEDGKLRYKPWNTYYSTVHPDTEPGTGPDAVSFEIGPKEYFTVFEEIDKSEGRMGTRRAGNFLDYPMAYQAARGRGVQGGMGEIEIVSPDGVQEITVMQADRSLKVIDRVNTWKTTRLVDRLQFLNRQ